MRVLLIATLVSILAGCGGMVRSSFTAYHSLTSEHQSKTVVVVPGNESLEGSLEFAAFKSKLESKLRQTGFIVSQDLSSADVLAYLNYGVDTGRTTSHTGSTPIFGSTGGGTAYHSGMISTYGTGGHGMGSYSGTTYSMPTLGIVGSESYSYNVTTYTRVLALDLLDRQQFNVGRVEKVYEVKLTSKGRCAQMAAVYDEMLDALFKDFPGESGKTRTVTIEVDTKEC